MIDNKGRRMVVTILVALVTLLLYFWVFAEPLSPELSAVPAWKVDVTAGAGTGHVEPEPRLMAFVSGDRFGYHTLDGSVVATIDAPRGTPVSDSSYILRAAGESFRSLRSADGALVARIDADAPFFSRGRLFSAENNGSGVAAYDEHGVRQWVYSFPCQISAFAAGDKIVVAGTVDGWLEGVGADGTTAFSLAPGGSRLAVVLGLDVSRSGDWVAAVTGIDRQRLVVLGRGGTGYRITSHKYLDSDYREPVRVVIMEDDRHVLYRRPDGIGVWALDGSVDELLPVKADDFEVAFDRARGIACLLARRGQKAEIVVFRLPATVLGRVALPDASEYVRFSGSSVFIGGGSWLGRFDFVED